MRSGKMLIQSKWQPPPCLPVPVPVLVPAGGASLGLAGWQSHRSPFTDAHPGTGGGADGGRLGTMR